MGTFWGNIPVVPRHLALVIPGLRDLLKVINQKNYTGFHSNKRATH
jgi:hypothetical protein